MSKRLMAKCRKLLQENEDLGKIVSSGNVAQLEHDLAYVMILRSLYIYDHESIYLQKTY